MDEEAMMIDSETGSEICGMDTERKLIDEAIGKINICLKDLFLSISPSWREIKNVKVIPHKDFMKIDGPFIIGGVGEILRKKNIIYLDRQNISNIIVSNSKGEFRMIAERLHKKLICDIEGLMTDSIVISFVLTDYPVMVYEEMDDRTIILSTLFVYAIHN